MTDTIRLYRVGPLPREILSRDNAVTTLWGRQFATLVRMNDAAGRWFTADRDAADLFRFEHPTYCMRHIDVSGADAEAWIAAGHPALYRYTDDPLMDYFVPAFVADQAVLTLERELVPEIPRC